jgi:hypothetical protein
MYLRRPHDKGIEVKFPVGVVPRIELDVFLPLL